MDPQRLHDWRDWADREGRGSDDEADAAFRAVFASMAVQSPPAGFAERVAGATARAARRQRVLARFAIAAGVLAGAALTIALLLQIPRLIRASLDLVVDAVVWTSLAFSRGVDAWTVLARIAGAIGSIVVTPQGTYVLSGLGLIAIAALYGLHRMLELEERSSI